MKLKPLKPGEHLTIVGKTRSGKTVAAQEVVKAFHAANPKVGIVIINPKPLTTDWDKMIRPVKKPPKWKPGALINWKVKPWEEEELNDLLWEIYLKGKPCLLVFDEGQEIKTHKYPAASALWRQGAEMGISVVTCTQRPVDISRYSISQAKYLWVYNIIGEDDLKALDSYMEQPLRAFIAPSRMQRGEVVIGKKLEKYHFYAYDVGEGEGDVLPPFKPTEHLPFTGQKEPLPIKWVLGGFGLIAALLWA